MCAIAGAKTKKEVSKMLNIMKYRGRDGSNVIEFKDPPFAIGMNRLAIVDVDNKDLATYSLGDISITYNGEVYNYRELRKDLEALGHKFETESDIEVVLKSYLKWGVKCFDKFNGMFAIAIKHGSQVVLARDIMGQKPLYYRTTDFAFASEAKALINAGTSVVRDETLNNFQHCLAPNTPYSNIKEFPKASYAIVDIDKNVKEIHKYWEYRYRPVNPKHALDELDFLLQDAIKIRTKTEVLKGIYLSGGVDSGIINSYSNFDYKFTYNYEENNKKDFEKNIEKIVKHLDFPVGSFSSYALYSLARKASSKVKVVLTGEGADEVFGGYIRYLPVALRHLLYNKYPSYRKLFENSLIFKFNSTETYVFVTDRKDKRNLTYYDDLIRPYFHNYDPITAMQLFDMDYILPSLLQMGDRMAMAWGIENRCPFLDRRIVEFGLSLPIDLKINNFDTKYLLRQLADKRGVRYEKEKKGLIVPYNKWYNVDGYNRDHYFNKLIRIWTEQNSHLLS